MVRKLDELLAQAEELSARFEAWEPTEEDLDRPVPPLLALKLATYRRAHAEREMADAVAEARKAGASWHTIGDTVGTSGEAARQRYGHLQTA